MYRSEYVQLQYNHMINCNYGSRMDNHSFQKISDSKPDVLIKVETLGEGHKIWKNPPLVLTQQLFLLSSIKTSGRFFQIYVVFSEKLDFIIQT